MLQLKHLQIVATVSYGVHELTDVRRHESLQVRQSQLAHGTDHFEQLGERVGTQLAIGQRQAVNSVVVLHAVKDAGRALIVPNAAIE